MHLLAWCVGRAAGCPRCSRKKLLWCEGDSFSLCSASDRHGCSPALLLPCFASPSFPSYPLLSLPFLLSMGCSARSPFPLSPSLPFLCTQARCCEFLGSYYHHSTSNSAGLNSEAWSNAMLWRTLDMFRDGINNKKGLALLQLCALLLRSGGRTRLFPVLNLGGSFGKK